MKYVNMIIHDKDMKVLKPLLERMGIEYTQKTIKEVDDAEALKILKESDNDTVLSPGETKKALKAIGIQV